MQDKDEKTAQGGAMTRQQAEQEMEQLRTDIDSLQQTLESPKKIRAVIAKELKETAKKYGQPRKTIT